MPTPLTPQPRTRPRGTGRRRDEDRHGQPSDPGTAIRQALALTRSSSARERTVDITTTGRRSGEPRRIEIWFYRVGRTNYLSGLPGKRSWYANLRAHPSFILHLKGGVHADLPATARPITDIAERHRILSEIVDDLNQPHNPARITQPTRLEDWENNSPLVEIRFEDWPATDA